MEKDLVKIIRALVVAVRASQKIAGDRGGGSFKVTGTSSDIHSRKIIHVELSQ